MRVKQVVVLFKTCLYCFLAFGFARPVRFDKSRNFLTQFFGNLQMKRDNMLKSIRDNNELSHLKFSPMVTLGQ